MMRKKFYGSKDENQMAAVEQLVQGIGPFSELYEEYEGNKGKERVLKLWLAGLESPARYVPGIHFTAKTIAAVGKDGCQVLGKTQWGESLDTVRIGKKAISFVADLDTCNYDPSKFALT